MLMAIPVVVMPDRADVARIGLEEEPGHGVDACRRRGADRTRRGSGRVGHRPLPLVHGPTGGAGIIVFRHGARIGQETRSALEPAVLIHHLFHGEGGDAAQNGLAKGTAEDLVDPAALRLRLLSLLSLPGCRLVVSTTEQTAKEIVEGVVVRLTLSAWLLLRHATAKQTTQQPAEHVVRAEPALPLWRLAWLRVRVWLGCTTAEKTAEETTQHVVHSAAGWRSTAALRRVRLASALDSDHSRASLAPLQHLGEGFALVVGKVADSFHGGALHHLGRGLAADLAQVVDRLFRRESFGGMTSSVAVDEVLGVGDLFRTAISPASAVSAAISARGAPSLPLGALPALSIVRFPAAKEPFQLAFRHRSPGSPSFWLTAGVPTLPMVARAAFIAAPLYLGIIGSIGDWEYNPYRGDQLLPASRVTISFNARSAPGLLRTP